MKKFKFTTLIVMIILVSMFSSITAFAQGRESFNAENPIDPKESLSSAKLLKKNDVLKIVETNIQGYIKTDKQTKDKNIVASNDFINLYDFEDNLFAYMVPLLENGKEIGYITVGAIEDGFATYEIFIDDNVVSDIKSKIKAKTNSKTSTQLVFLPPFDYIIKTTDGVTEKYFKISNQQEIDISDKVNENKHILKENYKRIRKDENKDFIERIIKNMDANSEGISIMAVTPENVPLQKEALGKFVPVSTGVGTSYGGDQAWYSTTTKRNLGCGPVASANITNYLAKSYPTKYGKLYTPSTMSKTDFIKHMDALYTAHSPGTIGDVWLLEFATDVENYAKGKGVTLKRVTSSAAFTLDNTANYIKNGLRADSPVATLNTQKWSDYEYQYHWMTITKYFRDSADNRWIAVSTWGERRSIDYRVHFNAMTNGYFDGGLMYFL